MLTNKIMAPILAPNTGNGGIRQTAYCVFTMLLF